MLLHTGGVRLKVLHTSDWHLGMTLCGRRREEESAAFLEWLTGVIADKEIDVLLVTGDIFDNGTPPAWAQTIYYRFLKAAAEAGCRHIIITAGNHDSPAFLEAPRHLLETLNIHVVGSAGRDNPGRIIVLTDRNDRPALIVCAVPYLRDRDIRRSAPGESVADKAARVREGIAGHYREVWAAAAERQQEMGIRVPVILTGHLFAAGGITVEGDGVRDRLAGSLDRVGADIFPEEAAYVALGHLHVPQTVGGRGTIRYPGSPVPVGFGEAGQQKEVVIVSVGRDLPPGIESVPVPCFRRLATLRGDMTRIADGLAALKMSGESAWAEVIYEGEAVPGDLMGWVVQETAGSAIEVLRVTDARLATLVLQSGESSEDLARLTEPEVFCRCMDDAAVPDDQREMLMEAFMEVLDTVAQSPDDLEEYA